MEGGQNMKRSRNTLLALACAATLGAAAAAAQQPQSQADPNQRQEQEQPRSQGDPQQRQEQQEQPRTAQQAQSATLAGCVYRAADQPTMFALRSMEAGASGASTRSDEGGQGEIVRGRAGEGTAGAVGTAGTNDEAQKAGMHGWYRLSSDAAENLEQYVGEAVRVTGTVVPGRDEKADVVIHRISPDKVSITALDLRPAPQFRIQTIVSVEGQECDPAQGESQRQQSPQQQQQQQQPAPQSPEQQRQ
jgi:hypothetical protein